METRRLGDLEVSLVGLGCNNFGVRVPDIETTRAVVDAALDEGVTLFDTADIYGGQGGSEKYLGEVLKDRWDQVVLASKFGMDMHGKNGEPAGPRGSAPYIRQAVEASLRRLGRDTIDLYQYHEPDGETPIDETLGTLNELVEEGTVRYIGCSNFSAAQLREAADVAEREGYASFVSLQNEHSLLQRSDMEDGGVLAECERQGVGVLPFFPLKSGLLTGKYKRGEKGPPGSRLSKRDQIADDETYDRLERFDAFASERGVEPIDVAVGWLAAKPVISSVIAGATKPEQVRRNVAAAEWRPSDADLAGLDEIFPAH